MHTLAASFAERHKVQTPVSAGDKQMHAKETHTHTHAHATHALSHTHVARG